jgi:hypothetical protein
MSANFRINNWGFNCIFDSKSIYMNKLSTFLFSFLIAFASSWGFSQEDGPILPTNISFDVNKLKQLDFGTDSLNADKILFTLFPAPMSEEDPELSEWKTAAYWNCSTCGKKEFIVFADDLEEEKELIPHDWNYTYCSNMLYYNTSDQKERAVASFSTSEANDGTGRFARGVLSIAHFEKQNGSWKLLNFNPFVNLQGSFTFASPIDAVLFDQKGKAYLVIHGGEANGVSPGDYWPLYQGLYVVDGETLTELLHIGGASCRENSDVPVGSIWDTKIKQIETTSEGIVFTISTTGIIVKEFNWYLPEPLQFISKADFESLPERFNFGTAQKLIYKNKVLESEKPIISIQYTDSKKIDHQQIVTTQNTRVK